jgi:hypothetical protein
MRIEELLARLDAVRSLGSGWEAKCPAHDDTHASLSIKVGESGVLLLRCFAGCETDTVLTALGLQWRDLFPHIEISGSGSTPPGLTLAAYAAAKQLPVDFLRTCGLSDTYVGRPVVRIPYYDETGNEVAVRFRLALEGASRFRWRRGARPQLYGLSRLGDARALGFVMLVEGESDCHTLWHHHLPALGLPGAASWRAEWAVPLDGIDIIYVVIEPDQGGAAVLKWLATIPFRDRVRLVELPDALKDPSALHLADPTGFDFRFRAALAAARPYPDAAALERAASEAEAWSRCQTLAQAPRLLSRAVATLRALGVVGERRAVKVLVLALVSRLLDRLVSVAVKGPSSAGKSFLVEQVLQLFPPSAAYVLSAMSEKALAYSTEPLAHRMLVLVEAVGLRSDFASYLVRSLLSEGRLRYETVEKTPKGLRPRLIEREGPTGLIVTTTALRLHPENETRLLSITVTDTREQTEAVLQALARDEMILVDLGEWHALHEWLALGEHRVVIPFARALVTRIRPIAVRLRRDVRQVLLLVKAHALLHRATRACDGEGRILATLVDYAVVRRLVEPLVAAGVQATVPATVRETVAAVVELGPGEVSVAQVARHLSLDHGTAWRRIEAALRDSYVINHEERPRRPARLTVGEPMPADRPLLPRARELRGVREGAQTPRRDPPDPQTWPPADEEVCRSGPSSRGIDTPFSPATTTGNGATAEESGSAGIGATENPEEQGEWRE